MSTGKLLLFARDFNGRESRYDCFIPHAQSYRAFKILSVVKLNKFKTILKLPLSILLSLVWLIELRPAAVIGVGGFASGPFVIVASLLSRLFKIRTGLLEQNTVFGLTNRVLAKYVDRIYLNFELELPLTIMKKIKVVGNPVRSNLSNKSVGDTKLFTIFIFGGSQGARGLNDLIINEMPEFQQVFEKNSAIKFKIIHQTGKNDLNRVATAYQDLNLIADVTDFIDDMSAAYSSANIVVCRSGASSLSELAAVGRPSVLVPLPTSSDDHQRKNALRVVEFGGACMLEQERAGVGELSQLIQGFIDNPQKLSDMGTQIHLLHKSDAAKAIVLDLISGD